MAYVYWVRCYRINYAVFFILYCWSETNEISLSSMTEKLVRSAPWSAYSHEQHSVISRFCYYSYVLSIYNFLCMRFFTPASCFVWSLPLPTLIRQMLRGLTPCTFLTFINIYTYREFSNQTEPKIVWNLLFTYTTQRHSFSYLCRCEWETFATYNTREWQKQRMQAPLCVESRKRKKIIKCKKTVQKNSFALHLTSLHSWTEFCCVAMYAIHRDGRCIMCSSFSTLLSVRRSAQVTQYVFCRRFGCKFSSRRAISFAAVHCSVINIFPLSTMDFI